MLHSAVNLLGFYAGWWACIHGAAHGTDWVGPCVVGALTLVRGATTRWDPDEIFLVLRVTLLGAVVETGSLATGVFARVDGPSVMCPLWMAMLWTNFAITLRSSLAWLQQRLAVASLMGAVSGPLSYWAGAKMGAIQFPAPPWGSLAVLGLVWALAMPLLMRWARRRTT